MKVVSVLLSFHLLTLSTFFGCTSALAMPGFNPKHVMRLIATVEPETCDCVEAPQCQIHVPYVKVIGVTCRPHLQFCCHPRRTVKAFVSPNDIAELHKAAARLRVTQNVRNAVAKAKPEQVTSTLKKLNEGPLIEVEPTPRRQIAAPRRDERPPKPVEPQCGCVPTSQCPEDRMEFTFGKSCQYGHVRCCNPTPTTTTTTTTTRRPVTVTTPRPRHVRPQPPQQYNTAYRRYTVPNYRQVSPQQLAAKVQGNARKPIAYYPGPAQFARAPNSHPAAQDRLIQLDEHEDDQLQAPGDHEEEAQKYERYNQYLLHLQRQQEMAERNSVPSFLSSIVSYLYHLFF